MKETEIEFSFNAGIIAELSQQLHDNRCKLKTLMAPSEYERVAPILETVEPFTFRADIYRIVCDAYITGACFDYIGSLEDVIRVCEKCLEKKKA